MLGFKGLHFPGHQFGAVQGVEAGLVVVAVFAKTFQFFRNLATTGLEGLQTLPCGLATAALFGVPGEIVEHRKLPATVGEQQVVVLGVNVHKSRGAFGEHAHVHRGIVHEAARAAGGIQHPADQQRAVGVPLHAGVFQHIPKAVVGSGELPFHHAGLLASGDEGGVSLGPAEQAQRAQKDALSRTRLAGNDAQTPRKLYVQGVYKHVILYVERAQHYFTISSLLATLK